MGGCLNPRGGYWTGALCACWRVGAINLSRLPVDTTEGQMLSNVEEVFSMTAIRIVMYAAWRGWMSLANLTAAA
jgi:hypothetical protein